MTPTNFSERAYLDLRERILAKRYGASQTLSSREIADEFDCAPATIGRVFQSLANEGYLELGARTTAVVRQWSDRELRDAIAMRAELMAFAAVWCSRRSNPLAIARLKAITDVLASLVAGDRKLDEISDCLALFETELCTGAGLDGLAQSLRNAFPAALIRKAVLVADDISLKRRHRHYDGLVTAMTKGIVTDATAQAYLSPDAIDETLIEENRGLDVDLGGSANRSMPFRGKETTYDKWAADLKQLPRAATA